METKARRHPFRPLPVAWDNEPIEWQGFVVVWSSVRFHAPNEGCGTCGSQRQPSENIGRQGRRIRLAAYRCLDCRTDTVRDYRTGEWWTLDESDYGPLGSSAPA